jgi:hypothetical protein
MATSATNETATIHRFPTIAERIISTGAILHRAQYDMVTLAAALDESDEWALYANTAAHWIADALDLSVSTAREWVRIGRVLRDLPRLDQAFATHQLSYSKIRAVSRVATPDNEADLIEIAERTPANRLGIELAHYLKRNESDDDRDDRLHDARAFTTWTDADGMVQGHFRLPPMVAAFIIAMIEALVMRASRSVRFAPTQGHQNASADASRRPTEAPEAWPSLAQQRADAFVELAALAEGNLEQPFAITPEVIVHVRGDGCSLDDGTPLTHSDVQHIVPHAFIRALVHDAQGRPLNASGKQRHPTDRQKRVVKERDRCCVDCRSQDLLEYDHTPDYAFTGRTIVDELVLRCAPCHRRRHAQS